MYFLQDEICLYCSKGYPHLCVNNVSLLVNYSGQRVPYGVAVQMQGVPGMAPTPAGYSQMQMSAAGMSGLGGVPGMTAVQVPAGMSRVSNGLAGVYPGAEKPAGLYQGAQGYPGLGQAGLLATSSSLGQPGAGYYASGQPTYIPVHSPDGQQRYMVSPSYGMRGAVTSQSMMSMWDCPAPY